jgi:hypothetical protein
LIAPGKLSFRAGKEHYLEPGLYIMNPELVATMRVLEAAALKVVHGSIQEIPKETIIDRLCAYQNRKE